MNQIPQSIIERDKKGVEQLTYYGVPVTELDRDGLLAALNMSEQKAQMGFANFNGMIAFNRFVNEKSHTVMSTSAKHGKRLG